MTCEKLMNSTYPDFLQLCTQQEDVRIDVVSWLNEWKLLMRVDPVVCVQQLQQLGWSSDAESLFIQKNSKEDDWEKSPKLSRKVLHAFIVGCDGVGKVRLIRIEQLIDRARY